MEHLLKNKKISTTPFRKEVLAIFAKYDYAISLFKIQQELTEYNRITLYRTIKMFIEKGIIHEINLNGEDPNYALCQDGCSTSVHNHQHVHFKCNSCSEISCVHIDKFPTIALPNYEITQLEIQASGLCEKCTI